MLTRPLIIAFTLTVQSLVQRAWAQETAAAPIAVPLPEPTAKSEVLLANPIKLTVSTDSLDPNIRSAAGSMSAQQAVQLALANGLSYRQSQLNYDIARKKARAALGRFGPNISFNTFYATSSLNQMLFYPNDGVVAMAPMQPIMRGSLFTMIFSATQPLFTGGYLTGNYRAARAQANQSLSAYRAERISTSLRVKQKYWLAVWLESKIQVDTDYVKFRTQSVANMKESLIAGKTARPDYLREEAELAKARVQLNDDYKEYNSALIDLKAEMGIDLGSLISLTDELTVVEPNCALEQYLARGRSNRPELADAEAKLDEARAKRLMARSQYYPHIDLYGLGSNLYGNSPDGNVSGKWGGFVSVIGHYTLFDSGQRFNQLRAASIDVRQNELSRSQTRLKVEQDVTNAWIDLLTARRNADLKRAEVASAEEDYRLFHLRVSVNKSIPLEEFDAAVKYFQARLALLESVYNYRLALDRLSWSSGEI